MRNLLMKLSLASLVSCTSAPLDTKFPDYKPEIEQDFNETHIFYTLNSSKLIETRKLSFNWGILEKLVSPSGSEIIHIRSNLPNYIGMESYVKKFYEKLKEWKSLESDLKACEKFIKNYSGYFKFKDNRYNINYETIVITELPPKVYVLVDTNKDGIADIIAGEIDIGIGARFLIARELDKLR